MHRRSLNGATLLDRVGQLVPEEAMPLRRARLVLTAPEEDVVLVGEGAGAQGVAQTAGLAVGVDAHVAEVGTEAWLHELPDVSGHRLATCRGALDGCRRFSADVRGTGT